MGTRVPSLGHRVAIFSKAVHDCFKGQKHHNEDAMQHGGWAGLGRLTRDGLYRAWPDWSAFSAARMLFEYLPAMGLLFNNNRNDMIRVLSDCRQLGSH